MKSQLPLQTRPSRRTFGSILGICILLISVAAATWLVFNRQLVVDAVTVWQFTPSESIEGIANRSDMSDKGRFYFYASQPEVDTAQRFNQQCARMEEHSAILGCYAAGRIYIYDISDERLDGIKEVTAAHEMLHAAWDRIGHAERERLGVLLEAEYTRHVDDDLKERMEYYARNQAGQRINELHSIIGTEISNISDELEEHYKRYFNQRGKLVSFHGSYRAVFVEIEEKSVKLATELDAVAGDITQRSGSYNSKVIELNGVISDFNERARSGGFATQSAFSAERSALVSRSERLSDERQAIDTLIQRYQKLRQELEQLNSESEALTRSIDSTLAPAPSI